MHDGLGRRLARADVVAIEADVDLAERYRPPEQVLDQVPQPSRDQGAASVNSYDRDLIAAVSLHDFVSDPYQRTSEILAIEDCVGQAERAPSWPRWTGLKEPTSRV